MTKNRGPEQQWRSHGDSKSSQIESYSRFDQHPKDTEILRLLSPGHLMTVEWVQWPCVLGYWEHHANRSLFSAFPFVIWRTFSHIEQLCFNALLQGIHGWLSSRKMQVFCPYIIWCQNLIQVSSCGKPCFHDFHLTLPFYYSKWDSCKFSKNKKAVYDLGIPLFSFLFSLVFQNQAIS